MVDGFHVTQQLQREDPEAFQALTSLVINFTDTGSDYCDFHLNSRHNIIRYKRWIHMYSLVVF